MPVISNVTRKKIISYLEKGIPSRQISQMCSVSKSSVNNMRKYLPDSCEKPKPGAPKKLTEREMRTLVNIVSKDPSKSAPKLADMMNHDRENKISPQTVRRVLKEQNFKAKKKIKKPLLTNRHRHARYLWAKTREHWTLDDWEEDDSL